MLSLRPVRHIAQLDKLRVGVAHAGPRTGGLLRVHGGYNGTYHASTYSGSGANTHKLGSRLVNAAAPPAAVALRDLYAPLPEKTSAPLYDAMYRWRPRRARVSRHRGQHGSDSREARPGAAGDADGDGQPAAGLNDAPHDGGSDGSRRAGGSKPPLPGSHGGHLASGGAALASQAQGTSHASTDGRHASNGEHSRSQHSRGAGGATSSSHRSRSGSQRAAAAHERHVARDSSEPMVHDASDASLMRALGPSATDAYIPGTCLGTRSHSTDARVCWVRLCEATVPVP